MRSHPGGQGWTLPWLRPDSGGYRDFDQRRLDDLALDVVCFWAWIKRRLTRNGDDAGFASHPDPEKLIAIFVPLWHEHSALHRKPIASTGFYQRMLLFEAHHGEQFEIVMTHDAEDLIHPESLA